MYYTPPSRSLSINNRSTLRDDSRPRISDWYVPSLAVVNEPMTNAGDLSATIGVEKKAETDEASIATGAIDVGCKERRQRRDEGEDEGDGGGG